MFILSAIFSIMIIKDKTFLIISKYDRHPYGKSIQKNRKKLYPILKSKQNNRWRNNVFKMTKKFDTIDTIESNAFNRMHHVLTGQRVHFFLLILSLLLICIIFFLSVCYDLKRNFFFCQQQIIQLPLEKKQKCIEHIFFH